MFRETRFWAVLGLTVVFITFGSLYFPSNPILRMLDRSNTTLHLTINLQNASWKTVENTITNVLAGGRFTPSEKRVALIVPYRDREEHLKIFLRHMHPFLQRQRLDYAIFVVEMPPNIKFNRGLLMNVGFKEALSNEDFGCFIFHDVDLLPADDKNRYNCDQSPRHLSVAIDSKGNKLPYENFFGGVCAISKEHFERMNGFSNMYFGWGGEDDDLRERVRLSSLKVTRPSIDVGSYIMIPHVPAEANPNIKKLFKSMQSRYLTDGLNSLRYNVTRRDKKPLNTWILVSVDETDIMENQTMSNDTSSKSNVYLNAGHPTHEDG